jgi:hypothetical protein
MVRERYCAHDKEKRTLLGPCKKCREYAGERKMTKKSPALFYVVCENCGHHTKGYIDQSSATRAWNKETSCG